MRTLVSQLDRQSLRPTIIVAAVIVAMFFGTQLLNSAIPVRGAGPGTAPGPAAPGPVAPGPGPTAQPVEPGPVGPGPAQPGRTLEVGPLRLDLPTGWETGQRENGDFRMSKGAIVVDLSTGTLEQEASASAVCAEIINRFFAPQATGFSTTQPAPFSVAGASAARAFYSGVFGEAGELEGQLTCIVVGRNIFAFDAWGRMGTLRTVLPEIEQMFNTMQVVQ